MSHGYPAEPPGSYPSALIGLRFQWITLYRLRLAAEPWRQRGQTWAFWFGYPLKRVKFQQGRPSMNPFIPQHKNHLAASREGGVVRHMLALPQLPVLAVGTGLH